MSSLSATTARKVAITGLGCVSPLGLNLNQTWSALIEGKSGVGTITHFDASLCSVQIAAQVNNYDVTSPIGPFEPSPGVKITQAANSKEARKVGRFAHFALSAALEAYGDSGLDLIRRSIDPTRIGVNIGVGMGGLPEIEQTYLDYMNKGFKRISPFFIPQVIPNIAAGQISILLGLQGPNLCNVTACASSAHSIGDSVRQIQTGTADIMVAGGAEAVISPLGIGGFASMRALSTNNQFPQKASRPYDKDRDGFVMGEGGAVLILEELEHAKKRGAKIYALISGYGLSGDAYHMTTPAPEGEGGMRAMKMALQDAGLNPAQIDYVNAHGTSTPAGDAEEALAIAKLLTGSRKEKLSVSSTKSMTGHLLGAAGAIETLISALVVKNNIIPPTINLDEIDPKCKDLPIDFTAHKAVQKNVQYALSNSFGFGGTNASLIVQKYL